MTAQTTYRLLPDGTFVIGNYNHAKPFSSFFPGVAGLNGVPMWAFYVNRGQGIATFGIKNKDNAIVEFYPANSAYGFTPTLGFRTFLKVTTAARTVCHEPFAIHDKGADGIQQTMRVTAHDLAFEETAASLGLHVKVRYFTLPHEPMAALVRMLEIENTGKVAKEIEVLDGLPKLIPYWISQDLLKHMSYTAQAWAAVSNIENKAPFFRLKVEIGDRPEVTVLSKGNFYFAYVESFGSPLVRTDVVVNPDLVFGPDKGFLRPRAFLDAARFTVPAQQYGDNAYPCAFSHSRTTLQAGKKCTLWSMVGHAPSEQALNGFVQRAGARKFFELKALENQKCIDDVTRPIATTSAVPAFDLYCRQTYLDNLLRGGTPIILPRGKGSMVFYVYSRKHGDLERDYNNFQLSPTYYSQGNGNFRDMNQNKRNDVFFEPRIGDYNVKAFYNLMQLDGYNPLLVKGAMFHMSISASAVRKLLGRLVASADVPALADFLRQPFEPGSILLHIDTAAVKLKVAREKFLSEVLAAAECTTDAEHCEGFWTDHWTYNLDLLESFTAIYPDRERDILFHDRGFTFYDNAHAVMPRSEKHVLADGKVRQFGSVRLDTAKAKLLRGRTVHRHAVRAKRGTGPVYHTTLAAKMLCLIATKVATLDPDGIGVEMEAERPSWYDALNGLPGIFGSSVPETFELKRAIRYLRDRWAAHGVARVALPEELYALISGLSSLLGRTPAPAAFWAAATTLKEKYRAATLMGVSGKDRSLSREDAFAFLDRAAEKIDAGLARARDRKTGLYYTYYTYTARKYRATGRFNHTGLPCVDVQSFEGRPLPFFLEAQVHYLKTETDRARARELHTSMLASPLYDKALGMYKVNASLAAEPADLGRCTVFAPGWLENESVWLHMEYKYLLELLKAGLNREFFDAFHKAAICFQKPETYGRSILENSSFIASSAFFNEADRGRGFVARLSGSTAECIDIWLTLTCGRRPFTLTPAGKLRLAFTPVLPGSYFTASGTFTATFLGVTVLRFHNPRRLDTYAPGMKVSRMVVTWNDGATETVTADSIIGPSAERIRRREAHAIDVYLSF